MINTMVLETGSKLRLPSCYVEVSNDEMEYLNGAWSLWGVISSSCAIVVGIAGVVGGIAALCAPEPTGVTKVVGWAAIVGGVAGIAGGIAGIGWALED